MKGFAVAVIIGVLAGCSSGATASDTVVALQTFPDSLILFRGQSLTLRVRALNLAGDSVAAPIIWRTADTGLITLDSTHGIVTSRFDTAATVNVQARTGTLISDPVPISLRRDTSTTGTGTGTTTTLRSQ